MSMVTGTGIVIATIRSIVKEVKEGSTLVALMIMIIVGAVIVSLKEESVIEMAIAGNGPAPAPVQGLKASV